MTSSRTGSRLSSAPSTLANHRSVQPAPDCCCFSARFINLVLFVFHFVFFVCGAIIVALTQLYGRPTVARWLGYRTQHLNAIIALLGSGHLVTVIHFAMFGCGLVVCLLSAVNIASGMIISWSRSGDYYYFRRRRKLHETHETLLIPGSSPNSSINSARVSPSGQSVRSTGSSFKERRKTFARLTETPHWLCCYLFIVIFLFTVQLVLGLLSIVAVTPMQIRFSPEPEDDFLVSIRDSVDFQYLLTERSQELEALYADFKCCGWRDFEDYEMLPNTNRSSPVSDVCCKTYLKGCGARKHPNNIYYDGCAFKFGSELRDYVLLLGWAALGFAVVELLGVLFALAHYLQIVSR